MITEVQKRSICADLASGLGPSDCAAKYQVSRRSIYNIKQSLYDAPVKPVISQSFTDWKRELKELAIPALKNSLLGEKEVHKAAGTAIQVLKGIGEFAADNSTAVAVHFGAMPEGFADRYNTLDITNTEPDE